MVSELFFYLLNQIFYRRFFFCLAKTDIFLPFVTLTPKRLTVGEI